MLKRYRSLRLGALLAVAISTGASAAEDSTDTKQCGGYYACIELQPAQPDYTFVRQRFFLTGPGSTAP
jgi:hypothetical protein